MPIFEVAAPNGKTYKIPADDLETAHNYALQVAAYEDSLVPPSRSWGEAGTDTLAGVAGGIGSLIQMPGQLAALAGVADMDNSLVRAGGSLAEWAEGQKSDYLKHKLQEHRAEVAQEEGLWNQFGAAAKGVLTDPALLADFVATQAPNMLGGGVFGVGARVGTKLLLKNTTEAALNRAGVAGAVAGNMALQGADVGADKYQAAYDLAVRQGMAPEQAHEVALGVGQEAALNAALIAGAATAVPGGASIEKALWKGVGKGTGAGALKTGVAAGLKEAPLEALEEGGGEYVGEAAIRDALDPTRDPWRNVGAMAGYGALGGGLFGAGAGYLSGRANLRDEAEAKAVADRVAQEEAAQRAEYERRVAATGGQLELPGMEPGGVPQGQQSPAGAAEFEQSRAAAMNRFGLLERQYRAAVEAGDLPTANALTDKMRAERKLITSLGGPAVQTETAYAAEFKKVTAELKKAMDAKANAVDDAVAQQAEAKIAELMPRYTELRAVTSQLDLFGKAASEPKAKGKKTVHAPAVDTDTPTRRKALSDELYARAVDQRTPTLLDEDIAALGIKRKDAREGLKTPEYDYMTAEGRANLRKALSEEAKNKDAAEDYLAVLDEIDAAEAAALRAERAAARQQKKDDKTAARVTPALAGADIDAEGIARPGFALAPVEGPAPTARAEEDQRPEYALGEQLRSTQGELFPDSMETPAPITKDTILSWGVPESAFARIPELRRLVGQDINDPAVYDAANAALQKYAPEGRIRSAGQRQVAGHTWRMQQQGLDFAERERYETDETAVSPERDVPDNRAAGRKAADDVESGEFGAEVAGRAQPVAATEGAAAPAGKRLGRPSAPAGKRNGRAGAQLGALTETEAPNAVQEQKSETGVLRGEAPRVELQRVGEKDAEKPAAPGKAAKAARVKNQERKAGKPEEVAPTHVKPRNAIILARNSGDEDIAIAIEDALVDGDGATAQRLADEYSRSRHERTSESTKRAGAKAIAKEEAEAVAVDSEAQSEPEAAETPRPVGGEDTPAAEVRTTPVGVKPGRTSAALDKAVLSGNTRAALRAIADGTTFTPIERAVARRLLDMQDLPTLEAVEEYTLKTAEGQADGVYNAITDTAQVAKTAMNSHVVLHEITHGAVHALVVKFERGEIDSAALRDLKDVYTFLKETRPELDAEYGYKSLTEFAAEVMSNADFQEKLKGIRYKKVNAFTKFARAVMDMLGVTGATESAFASAVLAVERSLARGRQVQNKVTGTGLGADSTANVAAESAYERIMRENNQKPKQYDTRSELEKWRDKAATELMGSNKVERVYDYVMDTLDSSYSLQNAMRKNLNQLFPEGDFALKKAIALSMSQTSHDMGVAKVGYATGGLKFDYDTGKFISVASKNNGVELARIMDRISAKYGLTMDKARGLAHDALVSRRVADLYRERDAKLAEAAALESYAASKTSGAGEATKRAEKLREMWQNAKLPMERAEAEAISRELFNEYPELNDLVDVKNNIRAWVKDLMVSTGLWDSDKAEWLLENADWIPFQREFDEEEFNAKPFGASIAAVKSNYKDYKLGLESERDVSDVVDNFGRWVEYAVRNAVKNHKARMWADEAVRQQLAKEIPETIETKRALIGSYMRDGKPVHLLFDDPLHATAFRSDPDSIRAAVPFMGWMNRQLRNSIVLFPVFSAGQIFADSIGAITSSGLPVRSALKIPLLAVKEAANTMRNASKTHEHLKKFAVVGVPESTMLLEHSDFAKRLGVGVHGEKKHGLAKVFDSYATWAAKFAMISDNATRQAIYLAAKDAGKSEADAVERAFEVINFRTQLNGKFVNWGARNVLFFSAGLAATRAMLKILGGKGLAPGRRKEVWRQYVSTSATLAGIAMLNAMANEDDDEYKKMSALQRAHQLTIPGAGGIGVPMRADLSTMVHVMATTFFNQLSENAVDPPEFRKTLRSLTEEILLPIPAPLPSPAKTAIEQITNHNFFTGREIIGKGQQYLEDYKQASASTSSLAVAWGEAMNSIGAGDAPIASPQRFDHFLRGVFGMYGGLMLATVNAADPDRPSVSTRDLVSSIPGLSRAVMKEHNNAEVSMLYDFRDRVNRVSTTAKAILDSEGPAAYQEYVKENAEALRVRPAVNAVHAQLTKIREQINRVRKSNVSADVKKAEIDRLKQIEARLVKRFDVIEKRSRALQ